MKKDNKKIMVYTDDIYEYMKNNKSAILEYLSDNDVDAIPNNIEDGAHALIDLDYDYFTDMVNSFDLGVYDKILIVYSLGLWNGTRNGCAYCKTLNEALHKCYEDINDIYFINKKSTLSMNAYHHDGENKYKFYKIVNGKKYAIKYAKFMQL